MMTTDKRNDWIDKARNQYIYDDGEDYPESAIEISEREILMQDAKENFRKAIEDNLPKSISREAVEKLREKYIKVNNDKDHDFYGALDELLSELDALLYNPQDDTI